MSAAVHARARRSQDERLLKRLHELDKLAEKLKAFDRLDANLLSAIISFASTRVKNNVGEPCWKEIQPTTVRDMKAALEAVWGGPQVNAWWSSVPDEIKPTARMRGHVEPLAEQEASKTIDFKTAAARVRARRRSERRRQP